MLIWLQYKNPFDGGVAFKFFYNMIGLRTDGSAVMSNIFFIVINKSVNALMAQW